MSHRDILPVTKRKSSDSNASTPTISPTSSRVFDSATIRAASLPDYYSGECTAEGAGSACLKLKQYERKRLRRRRKRDFIYRYDWIKIFGVMLVITLGICICFVSRLDRMDNNADFNYGAHSADKLREKTETTTLGNLSNRRNEIKKSQPPAAISTELRTDSNNQAFKMNTPNAPECAPVASTDIEFTLVTQLSYDRLWMIPHHCTRWGRSNPISIAIFTDKSKSDILETIQPQCDPSVLTIQTLSTTGIPEGDYPVNVLRNMALSAVKTSHVIYVDVDFWESENLYGTLHHPFVTRQFAANEKLAAVIPAFAIARMCREYYDCKDKNIPKMPFTKDDVKKLLEKRQVGPFDPTNRGGHGSTLYREWLKQPDSNFLDLPCIQSNRYEPYMAFRYCRDLPPFQDAFSGYGKNKMTFVMQMRRSGYIFSQLGGAFVVHYPHLDSASRMVWNEGPEQLGNVRKMSELRKMDLKKFKRAQVDATFVEFKKWLNETIPNEERTFMCEDQQDDDSRLWVNEN
mmetsp:Transcript_47071/g.56928  ORF Transcript_47071/g.56928 Transcript_47071/m.56928 type:complete len:516 (-) Transcript_47071:111-1658(-)|eukprot:CAMPEP_0172496236 /NCGR_PEP_ID=MMETSP1066-20121228/83769_1 /TAXON_ID=671091 /ORGANISM="Coscinodiscus wailesii, Strain CCMP2513" /LENGTH=515 /DNA_ID=CAMNT_0013268419 /DNA_START=105 /DNA_END=1652 /DNA_ORIENTATION=+